MYIKKNLSLKILDYIEKDITNKYKKYGNK